MNRFFIALAMVFVASAAFANAPTVTCELSWTKRNKNGESTDYAVASPLVVGQSKERNLRGFKLTAELEQVCAMNIHGGGGAPCTDDYRLSAKVKKGNVESSLLVTIYAKTGEYQRFSTYLTVGSDQAWVNCDLPLPE